MGGFDSLTSPVVLYDGECGLCNFSVQFILKHEKDHELYFCALQSEKAKNMMKESGCCGEWPDSLVLVQNQKVVWKSEAVIAVAAHLRFPWSLVRYVRIIPRSWRDSLYDWLARNRIRWFGKAQNCRLFLCGKANRFLD
ncbi:MAG: DCC1-like thiol-disulfide oxidoreductase family protein [Cytophagales bacterium]|nr:DCC1-like thiol-disulfide oxidoreductase family protein [Cytophagales bacterium]